MLKRIIIAFCLALGLIGGMTLTHHAQAATGDTTEVILHKRIFPKLQNDGTTHQNDGQLLGQDSDLLTKTEGLNGVIYDVYDATSLMQDALDADMTTAEFVANYTDRDRDSAMQLIEERGLTHTTETTTAFDATLNEDGVARLNLPSKAANGQTAAYYLIEREVNHDDVQVDIAQTKPMMIVLNVKGEDGQVLNPLHIYPKNDVYARDPYFFKFGADADGSEHRLAGAEFVFTKMGAEGQTLYLAANQEDAAILKWVESSTPATDANVARFTSDKNGLVATPGIWVPSGNYAFYEVKAPAGYVLDESAIPVVVPPMAQDENGERHVTVNGVDIIESDTGILPNDVIEKAEARVYNYKKAAVPETEEQEILPPTTSTPSKPAGTTSSGIIPQLGNNSSTWLILLGLAVMLGSVLIWRKRRTAGN